MKINNLSDLEALVAGFENGTINETEWRHAEHLAVAFYYLSNNDFEAALDKMRNGIFNLLRAFGVDTSKESPYHETLTVFWMKTVDEFRRDESSRTVKDACNELNARFDKDYPLRFYSREVLFSDAARRGFVEADRAV